MKYLILFLFLACLAGHALAQCASIQAKNCTATGTIVDTNGVFSIPESCNCIINPYQINVQLASEQQQAKTLMTLQQQIQQANAASQNNATSNGVSQP